MKKLTIIAIASLTLAGMANVSAATWNITNNLDKEICVTVNTAFSRIRRHFQPGESRKVVSKACLYSISVKEGSVGGVSLRGSIKGRCPEGLVNIAKATISQIDSAQFDALKAKGKAAFTAIKGAEKEKRKQELANQAKQAGMAIFGIIKKACTSRDFIIQEVDGQIKVLTK